MEELMKKVNGEYYISQRTKLLKSFDKIAKRTQKCLMNRYEEDFSKVIIAETRKKFDQIIPDLPYIGGNKNQFIYEFTTTIFLVAGRKISFWKIDFKKNEKTS